MKEKIKFLESECFKLKASLLEAKRLLRSDLLVHSRRPGRKAAKFIDEAIKGFDDRISEL